MEAASSQPSSNKSPCRICGRPKTAWSDKCKRCEANRQRYITALSRQQEDIEFLASLKGRTLEEVGKERGISRQAVHQLKTKAEARVQFLHQHRPPRLAFMS